VSVLLTITQRSNYVPLHKLSTVELHLSGLTGKASHPEMKKIRIIGFFFDNRLHWQFEAEKILKAAILRHILIYVYIKH
jgi:hypothetical protein